MDRPVISLIVLLCLAIIAASAVAERFPDPIEDPTTIIGHSIAYIISKECEGLNPANFPGFICFDGRGGNAGDYYINLLGAEWVKFIDKT